MSKKKYQQKLKQSPTITHRPLFDQEGIKQQLRIVKELEDFIPPLSGQEYADLEASILSEGCREALIVWNKGEDDYVLVDGHNRLRVCRQHQMEFKILLRDFENLEDVKNFMIVNQLSRRNLTKFQSSYLRGLRYLREKGEWGSVNRMEAGKGKGEKTAHRIAAELNVGQATIFRDAKIAQAIGVVQQKNPEVAMDILQGKTSLKNQELQALAKLTSDELPTLRTSQDLKKFFSRKKEKSMSTTAEERTEKIEEARQKLLEFYALIQDGKPVTKTVANQIYRAALELKNAV